MPSKSEGKRQSNFFDVCSKCRTSFSCCFGTRPPISGERRRIIERYLKKGGIPVENPFAQTEYVFPREDEEGYCIFHDKNTRRCLIHAVKPETCVAGPITFDINVRSGKIEWFVKMEKICQLAGRVSADRRLLQRHLVSAKREIYRLVDGLDSGALRAILEKEEPETIKIAADHIAKSVLDKLR